MRYVYSTIRFVPNPARGEFVNVGMIVGSEDSAEWKLRLIDNMKRARALDEREVLPALWSSVDDLERQIDAFEDAVESSLPSAPELSEAWLGGLWERSQNIIQFSRPAPIVAEHAEHAIELLWDRLVVDPESRYRPSATKRPALKKARTAYAALGIRKGQFIAERRTVQGIHHRQVFDFVVANGRAVQLTHTWSFQRPDQERLAEDLKSWAWTVGDIRDGGGTVAMLDNKVTNVPSTVDVSVVYTPPEDDGPRAVFEEALAAFDKVKVRAVTADHAAQVAIRARQLLANFGVQLPLLDRAVSVERQ